MLAEPRLLPPLCEYGVWRYAEMLTEVPAQHRIELGAEWAPVRAVSLGARGREALVMRSDLSPNGSHKDWSLAVQVSVYRSRGARWLGISSSGHAALSAAAACRVGGVGLLAFVSPLTPPAKLTALRQQGCVVVMSPRATSLCDEICEHYAIPNLRPSQDDLALEGYAALAASWVERRIEADSIFVYTTSGSTLCGAARGLAQLRSAGQGAANYALYAAQAGLSRSIAASFGEGPGEAGDAGDGEVAQRSVVGDLGAKRTRRKGELVRALRASGGGALYCKDADILEAHAILLDQGVHLGLESACAAAAAVEALKRGAVRRPMILATGHYAHDAADVWITREAAHVRLQAESASECIAQLERLGMEVMP
jgi:threonine synthase